MCGVFWKVLKNLLTDSVQTVNAKSEGVARAKTRPNSGVVACRQPLPPGAAGGVKEVHVFIGMVSCEAGVVSLQY